MSETVERVAAEMVTQIRLGHPMFCAGVHSGGEADWVEWEVAFIRLIATLRLEQVHLRRELDEARADTKRIEWLERTILMSEDVVLGVHPEYGTTCIVGTVTEVVGAHKGHHTGNALREAIDNARTEVP